MGSLRKIFFTLFFAGLVTMALILTVEAGDSCKTSETKTADAAITTSGGLFHGITVVTDATNAVTLNIYDNATAASGRKLIPTDTVITTSAADRVQTYSVYPPVEYYSGVYVDITCSGTVAYMVYFEPVP